MDRRSFLSKLGAGAAAAWAAPTLLGAAGCSTSSDSSAPAPGGGATTGPPTTKSRGESMLAGAAAQAPITNVVILMMENRSFDHWLGWLAGDAAYLEGGKKAYGADFAIDGNVAQTFAGPQGPVATRPMIEALAGSNPFRGCNHADPGHSWNAGRAQRDGGFLATGSGNDTFATGYFLAPELPFTSQLAKRFTVFDQSHASLLGPTYPNREYLLAAQSGGNKTNALPTGDGFPFENIFDRLTKAGVSVKSYYSDLPVIALWGGRMSPFTAKVDDFFTDAAAGKLPQVSFIDPAFSAGNRTDNHPHGDIRAGERFVRDIFRAYASSPQWKSGAFVLTYDEWGGFFDHVKPPILPDDRTSANDAENFGQAGFRVPTVLASPYSSPGYVDRRLYDHTSILRFLEWRFLGAPPEGPGGSPDWSLTTRDRNANNLGASLVTTPTTDLGFDLDVAIDNPSPDCEGDNVKGLSFEDKHDFERARDAGYFERVGMPTEVSSMLTEWV